MRFQIPNLDYIRNDDPKYHAAFKAMEEAINNYSDQGNLDPASAESAAPPQISQFTATEKDGIHDLQIVDNSKAYRGVNYFAYYSQRSDFSNEHKIDLGSSQNHRANLGPGKYYWRAESAYPTSPASQTVYHDAVGTGTHAGPVMSQGQSSSGFGPMYRNSTIPPIRK